MAFGWVLSRKLSQHHCRLSDSIASLVARLQPAMRNDPDRARPVVGSICVTVFFPGMVLVLHVLSVVCC